MKNLKLSILKCYIRVIHLLCGVSRKKILFSSFYGKAYSDNPRAISEAIHIIAPGVKIVWILNDVDTKCDLLPEYISCVSANNLFKMYKELATAKVFVTNFSMLQIPKHKAQKFLQTWHGDKAFKKVLHDSPDSPADRVIAEQIEGYCDLAVAGSEYGKQQYESAFRYKGTILMEGTPRNDRLVQNDPILQKELKRKLNIPGNTKLLLYAPTLRWEAMLAKEKQELAGLDISATLDLLEKKDNSKWLCLLRAHPAMVGLTGAGDDPRIMDVSGYEDMADLLLISDMLITDYSSCAGDFALLRRPLVLYQADRQEYLEKDRTFYFDIDESPYFVAQSQQELESIIADLTPEKAAENCDEILKFYGDCETGHAAESVAKIIKDWIER